MNGGQLEDLSRRIMNGVGSACINCGSGDVLLRTVPRLCELAPLPAPAAFLDLTRTPNEDRSTLNLPIAASASTSTLSDGISAHPGLIRLSISRFIPSSRPRVSPAHHVGTAILVPASALHSLGLAREACHLLLDRPWLAWPCCACLYSSDPPVLWRR